MVSIVPFTDYDAALITGRWVRIWYRRNGQAHTYLAFVDRAWITGSTGFVTADGSMAMQAFILTGNRGRGANSTFSLPAGGGYKLAAPPAGRETR